MEYYRSINGDMTAQQVIDAFGLNFNLGNVIKYIIRAGRKDGETRSEALNKALYYLSHEGVLAEAQEELGELKQ